MQNLKYTYPKPLKVYPRLKKKGKKKKIGEMNDLEAAYSEELKKLQIIGEIIEYRYEEHVFQLSIDTTYRPDFLVVYPTHFEYHEVKGNSRKGYKEQDGITKLKIAACKFHWYVWKLVEQKKGHLGVLYWKTTKEFRHGDKVK